ncbi:MAG: amino acid adenylation domain-containing protein, partial [Candidatus Aminicenantes bacterium]
MKNRNFSSKAAFAANEYGKEREYWTKKFSGEIKKSNFPYDNNYLPTTTNKSKTGSINFRFTHQSFLKIMELSKGLDHRLYIILAAGLVVLLYKYTGNNDIIIGAPIFKQETGENFINTVLALRNRIDDRTTFKELLLNRVRPTIIEANENQNYPIETLIYQLNIPFSEGEFPLFETAILLQNIHDKAYISHTQPNMIFSFLRTGEGIEGTVEYNAVLYRRSTQERIVNHFERLMEQLIFNVNKPVPGIEMLTEEEKRQLLEDFNNTKTNYPANKTIDGIFEEQVSRAAEAAALTYESHYLTYGMLNDKADCLASYLRQQGLKPEEPVALMVDNSHKVIVAVLAILKAGGTYLPLNFEYPEKRKKYILTDSRANLLLTNYKQLCPYVPTVIDLEDRAIHQPGTRIRPKHGSDHLAYIMYTSGSTGSPKGVMAVHKNVIRLVKNTNYIKFKQGDSILLTGALEFDASTFEIWGALLNGLPLHLVSKETLLDHHKLKQALRRNRVTTIWMTSPLFNQVLDLEIEVFAGLENLLVGGDVLSPAHINRVRHRYPALNVINGYGPTENTTFSTTYLLERDYNKNIPIGKPIANSSAYIVDRNNHLVPIGVEGELVVGGDGVARGYLNNPELTAEKFGHDLWDLQDYHDEKNKNKGPHKKNYMSHRSHMSYISHKSYIIYKTGDLARWHPDGKIEFLGRIDHQVKIRGYRIEPGEIENHLLGIEIIKEAVVIDSKDREGEKCLCAYVVPGKEKSGGGLDVVELKRELAVSLPDYMVPAYFVSLEAIPLTSNGKVDRRALPEPGVSDIGTAYAAPRNPYEKTIVQIWAEVLKIEKEKIGIDADFFELGGHSLRATILISKIHKTFNVKIPLAELFKTPTIRELSGYIKKLTTDRYSSIPGAEKKEYYELSSAQKRLYILQEIELTGTSYNIPMMLKVEGELNPELLENTFRKLIDRHASFRTSFEMINEKPVQKIHQQVDFKINYSRPTNNDQVEEIIANFVKPFNLSKAPLMRVGLIELQHTPAAHRGRPSKEGKEQKYILMVDIHHIITDGTSMDLLVKEFTAYYVGEELSPIRLHYKDYAGWQNSKEQKEAIKQQETYWQKQFAGEIPVLKLPVDYPRPAIQSFAGNVVSFQLDPRQTRALNTLALEKGISLYILLLTITNVFLSKLSNQEDIVIGTPIAARRHTDLERIIGMFVNTLAMRNYPIGHKTFKHFLQEVKERTLEAFENQEYQFEDLVEKVTVKRDASRNPLFDVALALPNMEAQAGYIPRVNIPQLKIRPYEIETRISKFDMTLTCIEGRETLQWGVEYCTRLFKEETIRRFILYFNHLIDDILENKNKPLKDMTIIPPGERKALLEVFNDTGPLYPREKTLPRLFAEQAARTPGNIALFLPDPGAGSPDQAPGAIPGVHPAREGKHLTYRELEEKSNQMTGYIRRRGARERDFVALMVNPSFEMIIAVLGILKAGCAYIPLDPKAPQARRKYILEECQVKLLLTGAELAEENYAGIPGQKPGTEVEIIPGNFAYVIFTSGSTGIPKGVAIRHDNLSPLLHWGYRHLGIGPTHRTHQNLSYYFDWSVWEIFITLTTGAGLYTAPGETLLSPEETIAFIRLHEITVLHATPTQYSFIANVGEPLETLKYLFIGAEKLSCNLLERSIRSVSADCRVFNMYGPTEATIIAAVLEIDRSDDIHQRYGSLSGIPIGEPVGNTSLLVLDKYSRLCPVNVPGELYIAGDGIAPGYLNDPGKTGKSFPKNFYKTGNIKGPRLYKTGDLSRWLPDGTIEFLGRIDYQIKIRGFRIELGEIETQLLKHPDIKEAVVTAIEEITADQYLCAYIVTKRKFESTELRGYLSRFLPGYMIPEYFVSLEKLPLTPNGKIDRSALPCPELTISGGYIPPSNETEKKLVDIWSEVLEIEKDKISIQASFFQMGGHSLKASTAIAKIRKEFNIEMPLIEIFKTPTIQSLAKYIIP